MHSRIFFDAKLKGGRVVTALFCLLRTYAKFFASIVNNFSRFCIKPTLPGSFWGKKAEMKPKSDTKKSNINTKAGQHLQNTRKFLTLLRLTPNLKLTYS